MTKLTIKHLNQLVMFVNKTDCVYIIQELGIPNLIHFSGKFAINLFDSMLI